MTAAARVRRARSEEAVRLVPALADVLIACVDAGASVVCVTHDPRLIEHATRVVRMEDGLLQPG